MKLPRDTWVPGEGPRHDDKWLDAVDEDLLFSVGATLFDRGQGFEAHEAWERYWLKVRKGGDADLEKFLRALIKLAAAAVKIRQGNLVGVREHAKGARALLESLVGGVGDIRGIDIPKLIDLARRVEEEPPQAQPVGVALLGKLPRVPD